MASPRPVRAAVTGFKRIGKGNKENVSEDGGAVFNRPALHNEVASSAKGKKKYRIESAGFNMRKSIAWNPAFFTEEGVLDNLELSEFTGSQLMPNGSPSSDAVNDTMSPFCPSGMYHNTNVLKEVARNSYGKSSAKYRCSENRGRRLFSSAKSPQTDELKEPASQGTQNVSSAIRFQKGIPRVPCGSIQKKLPTSTSTAHVLRMPKKPLSSLPMAPRSTTPTTVSKSNNKSATVKTELIHRAPGLLLKSKIAAGPSTIPAVAAIHDRTSGSVKSKGPQTSISKFGGKASTFAKPSALRMPSPSIGFFTQKDVHMSYNKGAEENAGSLSAVNTPSVVKSPRYKQSVDLKSGINQSKHLSTDCTGGTDLVSIHVTTDSDTNTFLTSEKRSLSQIISAYSAKSGDVNYQERPEVYCLLAGSGATTCPLSPEKNNGSGSSMPIVYKNTSHVEESGIIEEIKPAENSLSPKATCTEAAEDSCSRKATCSSTKSTVGNKSSLSCICSQNNDLSCQVTTNGGSIAATDLENSYVRERALAVSLSERESCTLDVDSFQNYDLFDHHNTEPSTLMESMECTLCADQILPSDRNSLFNDSLYDESKIALSEEPNTTELETNNASAATEDLLLEVGCEHNHNFKRTIFSPVKQEAPMECDERSVELNMEDKMVFGSKKLLALDGTSNIKKDKAADTDASRTNTILRDHLKNLVPFTEEWLAVMETCGQEILQQKSGAVQNSPPDKTAPEPSPWSPVKRKAQDVGPFDCTKYSKSVRTSGAP